MKKIILFIIAAYGIYYFYTRNQAEVTLQLSHRIVVGTSADYPPYAQIDLESGEIVGFEVDIIKEIAQRLGKEIVIKDLPFSSLILDLTAGQIDLIAAGLSPNEERKKSVLFSKPYIDNDNLIVISKKNSPAISAVEDLYNKSVAVNTGYTSDAYLSNYPDIQLVRLKAPADGIMALQSESVDAFVTSQSSCDMFLSTQPEKTDEYQFFNLPSSADSCALAYKKNNSLLQEQIDPIIDAMIKDGTVDLLKKKWGFA